MARGGYRPGAGRPKGATGTSKEVRKAEQKLAAGGGRGFATALEFAMSVINDPKADMSDKIRLAVAAMPFQHAKLAEKAQGKRADQADKAKKAASGKFAPPAPPKLVIDNS